jgi:lycopene cyclase domain-containing protein
VTYTAVAAVAVLAAVAADLVLVRLLRRRAFWMAYGIVVCFQLLTNGWLTGRGIVRYDPAAILGWRVAFAPVEDLWWVWWGRSGVAGWLQARRGPGASGAGVRGQADA